MDKIDMFVIIACFLVMGSIGFGLVLEAMDNLRTEIRILQDQLRKMEIRNIAASFKEDDDAT